MSTIEDFKQIITELIQYFENLNTLENQKLEAIKKRDIFKMENYMKIEQAEVLKLRGLDKKREKIQADLSYDSLSFEQIISQLPSDQQQPLKSLYDQLQTEVALYKSISSTAKSIIESTLNRIDTTITDLKNKQNPKSGQFYSNTGQINKNSQTFTNRRV